MYTGAGVNVSIDGKGIATLSGKPRIHVKGPWTNTEIQVSAFNDGKLPTVSVRSRSDHLLDPPRNGYVCTFHLTENDVAIKKEALHPIYTPRILTKPATFKKNDWNILKLRTINQGSNVKLEGYVNGTKVIEATDSGTWKDWHNVEAGELADMKKYGYTFEKMQKPIMGPTDTNYVRCDDSTGGKLKDFTIKEL